MSKGVHSLIRSNHFYHIWWDMLLIRKAENSMLNKNERSIPGFWIRYIKNKILRYQMNKSGFEGSDLTK